MGNKSIVFDKVFVKNYKKRILPKKKLHKQYEKMVSLFMHDPFHPQLKNHKLRGKMKEYRAFFVDDDCRVIYSETRAQILFLDIGKHEDVYR